jgi:apolipoprotein N-acyltransferase
MPAPLAGAATAAFCAFLALYPAFALAVAQRAVPDARLRLTLALPASWAISEWLRGTLLTGFPWLASGYAHTEGPLAGFAPVIGVYGVTLAAGLVAGALALLALPFASRGWRGYAWVAFVIALALGGGMLLQTQTWTQPVGKLISVRLAQANIPQDNKFGPDGIVRGFDAHWALMQGARVDLVALPESVFPVPLQFVPPRYLDTFREFATARNTAVIFGVFIEEPGNRYFNSAVGIAPREGELRRYSKRHLVPFGEFIPTGFRWFVDRMQMPIGDQERGRADQRPMDLAGQKIAVNICYEDLFGEEIIQAWRSGVEPTIMLNLSNLAWFDDSAALPQHLQISRMRVLETQHPMLRATNTGATAIIDGHGVVTGALQFRAAGALDGFVQGHSGTTPYIRFGNLPALLACALLFAAASVVGLRRRRLERA